MVTVTATLSNTGSLDSGGLTAAFFASLDGASYYVGSTFAPNVPAGGSVQTRFAWDTLGFHGEVPLTVALDPYDRLSEGDEENNEAAFYHGRVASARYFVHYVLPEVYALSAGILSGEKSAMEVVYPV